MKEKLGFFKWSILSTVVALVIALLYDGPTAVAIVAVLIALEASISFDNAVVNANVLQRMSEAWQRAFLTVGIVIAVVGMRLIFPILIVAVATGIAIPDTVDQALNDKATYASNVEEAAPLIGGFGGAFLIMVALSFLLKRERDVFWLGPIERRLAKAGRFPVLRVVIAAAAVGITALLVGGSDATDVLLAGAVGIVAHLIVRGAAKLLEQRMSDDEEGGATGAAGLALFLYLETLDASFSLDGVLGAFAISTDIVVIALGLGVGAIYIRSLTVYLVREGTLAKYRYLTHGANWAILALSIVLLASTTAHVPEWLTGTIGLGTIAAAFISSIRWNRRNPEEAEAVQEEAEEAAAS
jgi:hypothetical protein